MHVHVCLVCAKFYIQLDFIQSELEYAYNYAHQSKPLLLS